MSEEELYIDDGELVYYINENELLEAINKQIEELGWK